jgi:hypothetical protein
MFKNTSILDCRLISFSLHDSEKGVLVSGSSGSEIPFEIQRIYYLIGASPDLPRGNHANIQNQQVMVAVQGSFEVMLKDGKDEVSYVLHRPDLGLLVKDGIWREVSNFSTDAICLVICSEKYYSEDYVKDYRKFLEEKLVGSPDSYVD